MNRSKKAGRIRNRMEALCFKCKVFYSWLLEQGGLQPGHAGPMCLGDCWLQVLVLGWFSWDLTMLCSCTLCMQLDWCTIIARI